MSEIKFVDGLKTSQLLSLFTNYYFNGHLMTKPLKELTPLDMRKSLIQYIDFIKKDEDDERRNALLPLINRGEYQDFIDTIRYDQYFLEPLWHIANQGL
jgi:hypothetical protein